MRLKLLCFFVVAYSIGSLSNGQEDSQYDWNIFGTEGHDLNETCPKQLGQSFLRLFCLSHNWVHHSEIRFGRGGYLQNCQLLQYLQYLQPSSMCAGSQRICVRQTSISRSRLTVALTSVLKQKQHCALSLLPPSGDLYVLRIMYYVLSITYYVLNITYYESCTNTAPSLPVCTQLRNKRANAIIIGWNPQTFNGKRDFFFDSCLFSCEPSDHLQKQHCDHISCNFDRLMSDLTTVLQKQHVGQIGLQLLYGRLYKL